MKSTYKEQAGHLVKTTKLDYATLYPNNYEKQNVSLVLNVFNEKTVVALEMRECDGAAIFIQKVLKLWNILNVKGPYEGKHLNNPDSYPISDINDERLDFLMLMSTSFKLMDTSKKGKRIRGLTGDTSNAWHVTLIGLIDLVKSIE